MDLKPLIQEYFSNTKAMQLTTLGSDGAPWICTLYFVTDDDLNIYWTSAKKRQHSRDIMGDERAAVAIVKDIERKQGLQITGRARLVEMDDVERVNKLYGDKYGHKPERLQEVQANTPDGRAYWVFKPKEISLWDEVNFPNSPKQEYIFEY